jgi:hypothetical protein
MKESLHGLNNQATGGIITTIKKKAREPWFPIADGCKRKRSDRRKEWKEWTG